MAVTDNVFWKAHKTCHGSLRATAATVDTTLVTAQRATQQIFINRVIVYVTTDAAQSWSFEDSTGVKVCEVTSC